MNKEDLIKKCKYYKGEAKKPSGVDDWAWNAEKDYVEGTLEGYDFFPEQDWYANSIGALGYQRNENTPLHLRALLWSRYSKFNEGGTNGDIEEIAKNFVKKYDSLY